MSSTEQNFTVRRGDDAPPVAFTLYAADGSAAPAPASWMWKYAASPDGPAIVTRTGTNFFSVLVNGATYLAIAPPPLSAAETAAMASGQTYFHKVQVVTTAGKADTPTTGRIFVQPGGW